MSKEEEKKQDASNELQPTDSSDDNTNMSSEESVYRQKTDAFLQKVVSEMDPSDQHRYETFRRSNFQKGAVKKYINQVIGQAVNPNIVIGVGGLAKVFVGEVVMEALSVQKENNESGPLLPIHIHEAMRRIDKKMPNTVYKAKAPWNFDI